MQFSLSAAFNATAEIADSINHPLIRLFTVGQGGGMRDTEPLREFTSIEQTWSVASPASVGNGDFSYFSALCYLFGREVQTALGEPSLPMGMISANWGVRIARQPLFCSCTTHFGASPAPVRLTLLCLL